MPKITALPNTTIPATDDLLPFVDVSGTPTTRKATVANLAASTAFTGQYAPLGSLDTVNDAVVAGLVNDEASNTAEAIGTRFIPGAVTPIGAFGAVDPTGTTSISTVMQAAVDALNTVYVSTGVPQQVAVGAGEFRLDTQVNWKAGVGIRGAGRAATVFLPYGEITAFIQLTVGTVKSDCHFSDFTIDGINQAQSDPETSLIKGFALLDLLRCRFERVAVLNTVATGFGCDYMRECWFRDCYADGCGRLYTAGEGAGAGFGFLTGRYEVEETTVLDCVSTNNGTNGFFTEFKIGQAYWPTGFMMRGCRASGNRNGWNDAGSTNAQIIDCEFVGNDRMGAGALRAAGNARAGQGGTIAGCVIKDNGDVTVGVGGIVFNGDPSGYRIINNTIEGNYRNGIYFFGDITAADIEIRGNKITTSERGGIRSLNTANFDRLIIADNTIVDNGTGGTATTELGGIVLTTPTTKLSVVNNRIHNQNGDDQWTGINLRGALTSVSPHIEGNDLRSNTFAGIVIAQTVADRTLIRNNIDSDLPLWGDTFIRPDAASLGTTDHGSNPPETWLYGAGTWTINSESAIAFSGTGDGPAYFDSLLTDVEVAATIATATDLNEFGGPMARYVDINNYIMFGCRTNGQYALFKRVASTLTVVQAVAVGQAVGDVLALRCVGTTVKGYLNGVEVASATISDHASATNIGLLSGQNASQRARWRGWRAVAAA